jgi:hypothetical protein
MQRINFTESTLNTLKKTANCSFANAVYKLTMKAQQGLKCDDLYKKSVLMNDVNKILCNYKLDECIYLDWTYSEFAVLFTPNINTLFNIYIGGEEVVTGYTAEECNDYLINLGWSYNFNDNTDDGTFSLKIPTYLLKPYTDLQDTVISTVPNDIIYFTTDYDITQQLSLGVYTEKCYTEEELNCITPQDLQVLYEFTHKYKETLAKSTKKISNPSSNTNTSNSTDCCTWGSIGGNIGNQSDLVTYLANIEKNYISVEDEGTEITNDVKSINFTGNTTATDDGNGNVTVNVTGGGGGATNLSYTASPTNGVVNSDTGTDATIPLASGTNAGLMAPTQFTKLSNITVTQVVDLDTIESDTVTNNAKVSNATHTGDVTGATALTVDKTAITSKVAVTPDGADYILISDTSDSGNLKKSLISDLPGGGGVTPDLQQVLDAGNTSTTALIIDDGTNSVVIKEDQIKIANALAEAVITSPNLTTTTNFELPNKPGGTQTFAMLSDIATPDLQQVLDEGNISTQGLKIQDGAGNWVTIGTNYVQIVNPLGGEAVINLPTLDEIVTFELPDKPAGTQTFAMLSDITSSGVASVNSGININVDNTDPVNPIINSLSDRYKTTSLTSNTIGNGSKTFTVDANLSYIPLQEVLVVYDASNHMHGTVTSYSGTTLIVDIKHNTGSGTYTLWSINLDGTPVDAITGSGTAGQLAEFSSAGIIQAVPLGVYAKTEETIAYAYIFG